MKSTKITVSILLLALCTSLCIQCQSDHTAPQTAGLYRGVEYSYLQQRAFRNSNVIPSGADNTIELRGDSTLVMTSCAVITYGQWYQEADSVYFIPQQLEWLDDSLKVHGYKGEQPTLSSDTIVMSMKRNRLVNETLVIKDGVEFTYLTEVEKDKK